MRLLVMADIHGNVPALEAVLAETAGEKIDHIVIAGDLVCGPQPEESRHLLQSLDCTLIRGNGDSYLLRFDDGQAPDYWRTSKAFATIRWHYENSSKQTLTFLRALPEQRRVERGDAPAIRLVHGSPRYPTEDLHPQLAPTTLDAALATLAETTLICGHTHLPWQCERYGRLALNPGAVSAPLNGQIGAQYALLTWNGRGWQVEHRLVEYDLQSIRSIYTESGLLEEGGAFSRAWLLSIENGWDLVNPLLRHARLLADQAGFAGSDYVPDLIWERAAATFEWPDEK